ncbi:MAG: thiol-disulfide oxidoreductase DCC family protein [Ignavibacteriaceae bacterium]
MQKVSDSPVLFFDGVCNLCNSSVQFILKNDKHKVIRFASLQSEIASEYLKDKLPLPDSIVFLEKGKIYTESSAALKIVPYLSLPYRILLIFRIFPKFIRDSAYRYIAKNRYKWFGKKDECLLPSPDIANRFLK